MARPPDIPSLPVVPRVEGNVRDGHPWVYREALAVARLPDLPAGAAVDLVSSRGAARGAFVARGLLDPASPIAVRVFTLLRDEEIGASLFARRIAAAQALRARALDLGSLDAWRVCHGESDALPGLVVDRFGPVVVLKVYTEALAPFRDAIAAAVRDALAPSPETVALVREGTEPLVLHGALPDEVVVREGELRFAVDVRHGQKTGFFLDQREGRALLGRLVRSGDRVLDAFSYTGGFAVAAARAGAREVTCVDAAAGALEQARRNFAANGLDATAHRFIASDAFQWLASAAAARERFDVVVLDPPAFARSKKAVMGAERGYATLHERALPLLRPGGVLVTCSCTAYVTPEMFLDCIREGARRARVALRVIETRGQPADHPWSVAFPEGRYLKVVAAVRQSEV